MSASVFKSIFYLLFVPALSSCTNFTSKKADSTFKTIHNSSTFVALNANYTEKRLSDQFDVEIHFIQIADTINKTDSCSLRIALSDKQTRKILDTISLAYTQYCYDIFTNHNSIRSYSTGLHADSIASDNYFGDIVVADLNFDGKDDITVFRNCGGNGGPSYQFHVQDADSTFHIDYYLTDTMMYFPNPINAKKKQLITYVHAGACCVGRHTYQYNSTTNKWKQISHKIIGR